MPRLRRALATLFVGATTLIIPTTAHAATSHNPIGHLDEIFYDIKYGGVVFIGWAGDPDAGHKPVKVAFYVDGKKVGAWKTGNALPRPDVRRTHPQLGNDTGIYFEDFNPPPGRGTYKGCAVAMNVGRGSNTMLGCRSFYLPEPGALVGNIDSIQIDPANADQRIISGWVLNPYDAQSPTPFDLVRTSGPSRPLQQSGAYDNYLTGFSAGLPRPDVDALYPHNGTHHGFTVTLSASELAITDWVAGSVICIASSDRDYNFPGQGFRTPFCATYPG